jgi:hypothetical protein
MSKTLLKPKILRKQINEILHKTKNLRLSNNAKQILIYPPSNCIAKDAEFDGTCRAKERCWANAEQSPSMPSNVRQTAKHPGVRSKNELLQD